MTIKEMIRAMMADEIKLQVQVAKVKSVDTDKMMCVLELEGSPDMLDVRIRAVIDGSEKGFLIYPKKGSYVLVGLVNNRPESAYICGYSEVDKVRILIDDIELGGDAFGGIVKAPELKKHLDFNTARLDAVYDLLQNWTTTPQDGGLALQTAAKLALPLLTKEDYSDIENSKVKHG